MNEHLTERFGRSKQGHRPEKEQAEVWVQPQQLNIKIRQYFEDLKQRPQDGGPWLLRPEIPTSGELLDTDENGSASSAVVEIVPNQPRGAWESKESYLSAQYELLREDAVRMLRDAVSSLRENPTAKEEEFNGKLGIYEMVRICGITCSSRGIAVRVTFSLGRVGKKIRWEQSKRLISGGLVVLTPAKDMYKTAKRTIVATVAGRPLSGLELNPPEIDLYFARAEELEIDPAEVWVMIEERQGFYEAHRHTLLGLQMMMRESFPLAEHLVDAKPTVSPPQYVLDQPKADLTAVLRNNRQEKYENVHILRPWPVQPSSDLDSSQLAALQRMLTKRLAIIQGPPGCGKTHVSVQAIKVMLQNRLPDDPPIILACQTNHAIDQLLRHVSTFEKDFVRLGGRSKDKEVIKARTLYEVRNSEAQPALAGCYKQNARKKMKDLEKEFGLLLSPLEPQKVPLDFRMLEKLGLLTKNQADTLEAGASQWVQAKQSNTSDARTSPFTVWLSKILVTVPPKQKPESYEFELEEADLGFEQLKELEAENMAKDDEDFETLNGLHLPIADNFTCRKTVGVTSAKVKDAMKQQDMWKIPEIIRGEVYRHLQIETKKQLLIGFREKARIFNQQAAKRHIGQWEEDELILKSQKVIGMTTTGFSKYRALLSALQPKIVLIEEAAETLEAPITVTCLPSLQHLILVGDHKQLRPHCHVKALEDEYSFNISLFERMINNNVEYNMLAKQRRMIPEVRRILYPIYGNKIEDHPSVLDPAKRPNVPGMGGMNSCFFTHAWEEQRDEQMSAYNKEEAEMVIGLATYLNYNGVPSKDITILTFYNGQRKRLLRLLRESDNFQDSKPMVATVDSYQGEENKIVLLSLVRSNEKGQVGFLDVDNRVCVALSRAQCGFYIFGNGGLLYDRKVKRGTKNTWRDILDIMRGFKLKKETPKVEPSRLLPQLPIRCSNHGVLTQISDASDWQDINGGCEKNECGLVCSCKRCMKKRASPSKAQYTPYDGQEHVSRPSSSDSWTSYAKQENVRYVKAASTPALENTGPQKGLPLEPVSGRLLELGDGEEEVTPRLNKELEGDEEVTPRFRKFRVHGMDGAMSDGIGIMRAPMSVVGSVADSEGTSGKGDEMWVGGARASDAAVTQAEGQKKDWSRETSLLD
ncbi:hypothetical protein LTR62_000757 [Meristemomyces frigidus]|uniref:P-loop containing nucleoside triphosphate hydrolase protein n=1 Tax=Meristemomyces frigidus TaxID=1508187 RepID=A0AAN7YQR2_9PEZI|nr:hypothetical protein LTR62_000757 [Meristemomyces frigidus]